MTNPLSDVELMDWADEAVDGFAKLQKEGPLTTPDLLAILSESSAKASDRPFYLAILLATAIQKLSQHV